MVMAPTVKVVLGSFAFAVFWVLAVFPAVPFLPIGRTAGSLLGAMLMVLFQVITPDQAYAAIDLPILGLLFGTMVVSVYLERADMFGYLGKLLSWRSKGPKDLLCRLCVISAISSALFTNDTTCVVLTEFVLKIARQHNLPPHPFLLALASSANIGSAATPIGNPQNLVIAVQSKITFGVFLIGLFPAMVVGVIVNTLVLLCMYWKLLSDPKDVEDASSEVVPDSDVVSHRFSPATMSHLTSLNSEELKHTLESTSVRGSPIINGFAGDTLRSRTIASEFVNNKGFNGEIEPKDTRTAESLQIEDGTSNSSRVPSVNGLANIDDVKPLAEKNVLKTRWRRIMWKSCVYLITLGMLVGLLMGLNMSWTAVTAALALIVLDFKDARPCLEKVLLISAYYSLCFFKKSPLLDLK
ncbi:hypothetical protein AgCh_005616 [Apium graveolens]